MNFKRQVYIFLIFLIHCSIQGFTQSPLSTVQIASGGSKSIIAAGQFNLINPISNLNLNEGWNLLASTENRFFADIQSNFISLAQNSENQGFIFGFHDYGIDGYSINTWSLGYGRKLSTRWQIGARMKIFTLNIQETFNQSEFNVDLSLQYHMFDPLKISILIENLNSSNNLNPSFINFGAQLKVSKKLILISESQIAITKAPPQVPTVIIGIHYQMIDRLNLYIGVNTTYQGPSIGLTYDWKAYSFSIGVSNHAQLGRTSSFSLGLRI